MLEKGMPLEINNEKHEGLVEGRDVFYRVQEWSPKGPDNCPEEIKGALDFSKTDKVNYVQTKDGKHLLYSQLAWYVEGNQRFHIVDVCVAGGTKEEAEEKFLLAVAQSSQTKERSKRLVEEMVLPQLNEIPEVVGVIGRGDIFDPDRLAGPRSDINLVVFSDFPSSDAVSRDRLQQAVSALEGEFGVAFLYYTLTKEGYQAKETKLRSSQGRPEIDIAVLSSPDLDLYLDRIYPSIPQYNKSILRDMPILNDKERKLTALRNRVLAIETKES